MSAEATAKVLGLADDDQAWYAAAPHRSPCLSVQCATCHPTVADGYNDTLHKTSVSPARSLPLGEAEPDSFDADAVGAPASEDPTSPVASEHGGGAETPLAPRPEKSPRFEPVDSNTADLLTLLAEQNPATPQEVREWDHFVATLRAAAGATGLIDQNEVRPLLRGEIKPSRIGAFYRRAALAGLIRPEGTNNSDDLVQRNRGKPTRVYRWLVA